MKSNKTIYKSQPTSYGIAHYILMFLVVLACVWLIIWMLATGANRTAERQDLEIFDTMHPVPAVIVITEQ